MTTAGLEPSQLGGAGVAARLAAIASSPEVRSLTGSLVLTGGDVAAAVCRSLGGRTIWVRGEVLPAIPWVTLAGPGLDALPAVTKAGSFGSPDAIQICIEHLQRLGNRLDET